MKGKLSETYTYEYHNLFLNELIRLNRHLHWTSGLIDYLRDQIDQHTTLILQGVSNQYLDVRVLPEAIGLLSKLRFLEFHYLHLRAFPDALWTLPCLERLEIRGLATPLEPENLTKLPVLRSLYLEDVPFTEETAGSLLLEREEECRSSIDC